MSQEVKIVITINEGQAEVSTDPTNGPLGSGMVKLIGIEKTNKKPDPALREGVNFIDDPASPQDENRVKASPQKAEAKSGMPFTFFNDSAKTNVTITLPSDGFVAKYSFELKKKKGLKFVAVNVAADKEVGYSYDPGPIGGGPKIIIKP